MRCGSAVLPIWALTIWALTLGAMLTCFPLSQLTADEPVNETAVFEAGKDGYHTYRIPALISTSKRTLLAFCEGRKTSRQDHGDVDLLLKRSTDGGKTWSPQKLIYEEGGDKKVTIGNPCPVVDWEKDVI